MILDNLMSKSDEKSQSNNNNSEMIKEIKNHHNQSKYLITSDKKGN